MPVTILEVRNRGSRWKKIVTFEHEEDLGVFRKKLADTAIAAMKKRFQEGRVNPVCIDDIWADIEHDFPSTRYQHLDLLTLLGLSSEAFEIAGIIPGIEHY